MIYICDELAAECDHVSFGLCHLDGKFAVVSATTDYWSRSPDFSYEIVRLHETKSPSDRESSGGWSNTPLLEVFLVRRAP